ncbi:hypothetical protein Tco_1283940 [Tanacetum coccineum]
MEDDIDISTLSMEHYIALIPDDIKPCIVNPKIGDDIELRRKLFAGTDDEDAYEHVRTVLEIVDLFHFPCVTHDAIMLRVFPITLTGKALRWKKRLPKLKEIHNFKQERDETLYHVWERYNDLLYQCPLHDLNCQQKVHIFYTGLDISTRKILESNGFIPLMTPTQALESIQVMADHSHDWYDETTTRERIDDVLDNVDAIYEREKVKEIMTMGKENMKEPVPRDLSPMPFLGHLKEQMGSPYRTREIVRMIGNPKEIHNAKAREDEGDMDVGWDITSKVQPYIPLGPVHDMDKIVKEKEQDYDIPLNDNIMQPLTPQTIHITPPGDDYVAPTTNPIFNKQLNKFEEKFSNITKVAEKEYDNPVIKTYDCETFIQKLLHQVSQSSREMKSQQLYYSNSSFPYLVANHGVHCYSYSHLISSEERNTLLLGK